MPRRDQRLMSPGSPVPTIIPPGLSINRPLDQWATGRAAYVIHIMTECDIPRAVHRWAPPERGPVIVKALDLEPLRRPLWLIPPRLIVKRRSDFPKGLALTPLLNDECRMMNDELKSVQRSSFIVQRSETGACHSSLVAHDS